MIRMKSFRISMFDSKSENPELIWNEATRSNVKMIVKNGCNQLYAAQQVDPNAKWNSVIIFYAIDDISDALLSNGHQISLNKCLELQRLSSDRCDLRISLKMDTASFLQLLSNGANLFHCDRI